MKFLELLRLFIMMNVLFWYLIKYILQYISSTENDEKTIPGDLEISNYNDERRLYKYI
jgi:hypothetical protein